MGNLFQLGTRQGILVKKLEDGSVDKKIREEQVGKVV